MSSFDELMNGVGAGKGPFLAQIPGGWGQGRAAYGGISGGLVLRAAAQVSERPIRSLSLNFVGPLAVGEAEISARILREGRSATHVASEISQGDEVVVAALVLLGDARDTAVDYPGPEVPEMVPPSDGFEMPFYEGLMPDFTRNFSYRWTTDSFPFSGGAPHVQGWIRAKEGMTAGPAGIVGLIDAWPPPVWSMLDAPYPGSSVTWFVSFTPHAYRSDLSRDAWWRFDSKLTSSNDGYAHFESHLWNEEGEHVAISRQVFAEFSKKPSELLTPEH